MRASHLRGQPRDNECVVFDANARTSFSPAEANGSRFAFLNRSATRYFRGSPPSPRRVAVACPFTRSGASIDIHPDIAGSAKHPDFLVNFPDRSFYLEAVRVGAPPSDIGEQKRLAEVEAVIDSLSADKFTLHFSWDVLGPTWLGTRKLKDEVGPTSSPQTRHRVRELVRKRQGQSALTIAVSWNSFARNTRRSSRPRTLSSMGGRGI